MSGCWCVSTASSLSGRWERFFCSPRMFIHATARPLKIGGMNAMPGRKIAALGLLCVSLLPGAGFDSTHWKFQAPLRVLETGRLCAIPFDRTLYARMRQDLGDLRIVKDGEEIPYLIETLSGSVRERECRPAMLNKSVIPETGVQITLDIASCKDNLQHSRLRLATAETNFRQKVRIETSDDNSFWLIARDDAYIFDF